MKSILKYVGVFTLLLVIVPLTACNGVPTTTTTTSTITPTDLPTIAPPDTEPFTMPDNGVMEIDGQNYYYQRVYAGYFTGPTLYRNVIFGPKDYGTATPTGVSGWFTVTFADNATEDILFAGTLMLQTDYRLTQHDNPRAGIMEAYGDNCWVMYVLVSAE
jgi:hypothetical protein